MQLLETVPVPRNLSLALQTRMTDVDLRRGDAERYEFGLSHASVPVLVWPPWGLCSGVQHGKVPLPDISIPLAKTPKCLYTTFSTPSHPAQTDSSVMLWASLLHWQSVCIRKCCFPPSLVILLYKLSLLSVLDMNRHSGSEPKSAQLSVPSPAMTSNKSLHNEVKSRTSSLQ